MRNTFAIVIVLSAVVACVSGCEMLNAFQDTETAQFAEWFGERLPAAAEVAVQEGVVSLTMADGSVESRPLPASADFDEPGAVFGKKAVEGIERSLETGSPWPAVAMTVEGLALAVAAWFVKKQREAVSAAVEMKDTRQKQLSAVVEGIWSSPAATEAKKLLVRTVKDNAIAAGVEYGPDGLKAFVNDRSVNVAKESGSGTKG